MQLELILPKVVPMEIRAPTVCPYKGCDGRHFRFHQAVEKPLRDTGYRKVVAHRYEGLRCKRTFRVHLQGVARAQTSLRVKGGCFCQTKTHGVQGRLDLPCQHLRSGVETRRGRCGRKCCSFIPLC